ncbi:PEP-CTERM sorting domain-containing protein [Muricoccus vinaceus]|uniref:PEP-CTERM sorting domain-containing protein n=1 Tax=Muricoccus vinaceus TaxID=424704 RepID=A0ABV6IQ05_9PROT
MDRTRLACMGLCMALLAGAAPARADFIGQAFTPTYEFPVAGAAYGPSSWSPASFTVGAGVETTGLIEGVTSIATDFSAARLVLVLSTDLVSPTWSSVPFNGPVFTSGSNLGITGAVVDALATTLAGFDDSRVSFTGNEVRINWNGLSYITGSQVAVDFTFSQNPVSVPEPSTLALFGLGLLGLGAARARAMR